MPHICAIFALRPALGPCSFARRPTQKNLGTMYYNGQGVPQDYAQAAYWYRKAADQGDAAPNTSWASCTSKA